MCGETEDLHLHHMTYERVGAEDLADLTPLCPTCHHMVHLLEARGEIALDFEGLVDQVKGERHQRENAEFLAQREKSESVERAEMEERAKAALREMPLGERLERALQAARNRRMSVTSDKRVLNGRIKDLERELGIEAAPPSRPSVPTRAQVKTLADGSDAAELDAYCRRLA